MPGDVLWADRTDLNYDVCVTLSLSRAAAQAELLLSLVGPYATLLDVDSSAGDTLSVVDADDMRWADVSVMLAQAGFETLSAEELGRRTPIKLSLCIDSGCTVFNALFRH